MVDGEVGLHGPELVVLEGGPHALGLLRGAVLGVPVHGLAVVLVTAQSCGKQEGTKSDHIHGREDLSFAPSHQLRLYSVTWVILENYWIFGFWNFYIIYIYNIHYIYIYIYNNVFI